MQSILLPVPNFLRIFTDFADDGDAWIAVITGAGNAFCAGADLRAMSESLEMGDQVVTDLPFAVLNAGNRWSPRSMASASLAGWSSRSPVTFE
jgi:enoyl-CoA hydratase/carnithine racemase